MDGTFFRKKVSIHLSIYACHPYSRGQANLLCIVPISTDDDFRHSDRLDETHLYKHNLNTNIVPTYVCVWSLSAEYGSAGCDCQSCYRDFATDIWSRETGSVVPSRASPLILHTRAESGAYSRDYSRFPRRCPNIILPSIVIIGSVQSLSGQCQANCVPMAFTA